jgi:hypothetical protein
MKMSVSGWVRDLASFASIVAIASWQGWEARELIWGLWISSLVIGYAFILISSLRPYFTGQAPCDGKMPGQMKELGALAMNIFVSFAAFMILGIRSSFAWIILLANLSFGAAAVYLAKTAREGSESPLHTAARRVFTFTPCVAFTLGFFTVHFGGFHFVHGLFLNGFFPIVDGTPFGESIGGTLAFFLGIAGTAARSYWPMVMFSAWSRLGDLKRAAGTNGGPGMLLPYICVVKMHILIFVFAGLYAAGLRFWALYPVLIFYFFPAGSVLKAFATVRRRGARAPV